MPIGKSKYKSSNIPYDYRIIEEIQHKTGLTFSNQVDYTFEFNFPDDVWDYKNSFLRFETKVTNKNYTDSAPATLYYEVAPYVETYFDDMQFFIEGYEVSNSTNSGFMSGLVQGLVRNSSEYDNKIGQNMIHKITDNFSNNQVYYSANFNDVNIISITHNKNYIPRANNLNNYTKTFSSGSVVSILDNNYYGRSGIISDNTDNNLSPITTLPDANLDGRTVAQGSLTEYLPNTKIIIRKRNDNQTMNYKGMNHNSIPVEIIIPLSSLPVMPDFGIHTGYKWSLRMRRPRSEDLIYTYGAGLDNPDIAFHFTRGEMYVQILQPKISMKEEMRKEIIEKPIEFKFLEPYARNVGLIRPSDRSYNVNIGKFSKNWKPRKLYLGMQWRDQTGNFKRDRTHFTSNNISSIYITINGNPYPMNKYELHRNSDRNSLLRPYLMFCNSFGKNKDIDKGLSLTFDEYLYYYNFYYFDLDDIEYMEAYDKGGGVDIVAYLTFNSVYGEPFNSDNIIERIDEDVILHALYYMERDYRLTITDNKGFVEKF